MRIVIIGLGKIGISILERISKEGHDLCVIDSAANVVNELVDTYDVLGVSGNGANYDIQMKANVDKADLVVTCTSTDEVNLLACLVAKKIGARHTIARIRNHNYYNQLNMMREELGLSMIINPEQEAANEIVRILDFPQANKIDTFAKGKIDLMEILINDNNLLVGMTLQQIRQKYQFQVLVCAVQRGEDVFIPGGDFRIEAKDKIHVTAPRAEIIKFLGHLGMINSKIKSVMIVGGSKIAFYLANTLLDSGYKVILIDNNKERCEELSLLLPGVTVICGDGTDQELLLEEGISQVDAFISLTGMDEENIITSMFANSIKVPKVICKINRQNFVPMAESTGVASIVSPKIIAGNRVVSYIRALGASHGSGVVTLYKLVNNEVEAMEFNVKSAGRFEDIPIKDLNMKKGILICSIIRGDKSFIPSANDYIKEGDSVIVVTNRHMIEKLDDILID